MRCLCAESAEHNKKIIIKEVQYETEKFLSGAVTAALFGTMMCSTVFAAEPANGSYTGEIHFLNANGSGNNSMCDPIFCHEADVVLTDDSAELTFYVAYPIPAFPDQGTDGTVLDVVLTVDGTDTRQNLILPPSRKKNLTQQPLCSV